METHALLYYSGIMGWITWGEALREMDSDCRTGPTYDGHHDFIRTLFWAFKYFMESLPSLLSNGSSPTPISARSRPQSLKYYRVFFCPRCCVTLFWPNGPCIKLGPLGTRPRVGGRPKHSSGRPPIFLYPSAAAKNTWVLFRSSLAFATCL